MKTSLLQIVCMATVMLSPVILSCEKYLAEKPDQELSVPGSLGDLQMLLDNYGGMNEQLPSAPILLADNIYLTTELWESAQELDRNLYLWKKYDNTISPWYNSYAAVNIANTVLDELMKIDRTEENSYSWDNICGSALFFRATYFLTVAQLFAPAYHSETIDQQLGIPLRLNSDFNERSVRSTVGETYQQIIDDFKTSAGLLPVSPIAKSRPSKPAAYGALARVYLLMHDYKLAGSYADSCLQLYAELNDYSSLDTSATAPFERFNPEVIFHIVSNSTSALSPSSARIDTVLYQTYATDDLRRTLFFKKNDDGTHSFRGDYDGQGDRGFVFGGITTDETFLIKAECAARMGDVDEAMQNLNTLLEKRWKPGTFIPFAATDQHDALRIILEERRKELVFRGTRWSDIRRLASDPAYSIAVERFIGGQHYMLAPQIPGYLVQIPEDVIEISGMTQNP